MDEKQNVTANDNVENKEVVIAENAEQKKDNAEKFIPKQRFDEVNNKLKDLMKFKEEYEVKSLEAEKNKMFEEGKKDEFYKNEIEKLQNILKEKETEVLNVQKQKIIEEYKIPETFHKFIVWNNIDEIKENVLNIHKELDSAWLIKKQEVLKENIDTKANNENKNKQNGMLTREDIAKMSNEEYQKRKDEIHTLLREWKIK